MYTPDVFREERIEVLHAAMTEIATATVVSASPSGLIATHVPVEVDPHPARWGTVRCHFARSNSHAAHLIADAESLLIFQGPEAYVSPSWYPTKQETGKVVPTLNYVAIHAYGRATPFEDVDRLRLHLSALTARFERDSSEPWAPSDAPAEFIDSMCRGVVGVEIPLDRIEGKWKVSQNQPDSNRTGVVEGLRDRAGEGDLAMADRVERAR